MNSHFKDTNTRRVFLRTTAAVGLTIGCGAPSGSEPEAFGSISAGSASAFAVGTLEAVPGWPVIIGRDGGGFYAMTSTCTHAGCDMAADGSVGAEGVFCGCHGSRFDANGAVLRGPASAPLAHFKVSIDASGSVTIDGNTKVSASTRTPAA